MKRAPLFLVALALLSGPALAQVTTATILGRVVDSTGGVMPGVDVRVTNPDKAFSKSAITNDRGEYTLTFLPVGTYTLTVNMPGFSPYEEQGVVLSAGQKLAKTITLSIGTVDQTVTVTSEPELLNTVNAQDDIRLNEQDLKELPILRRDLTNVLNLGAGTSGGSALSLNGLPPRGFVFTIDGSFSNPDPELPGIGMYQDFNVVKGLSIEAISEIQTSKNVFSAETANTVGGNVNVISKSGTNDFHGSMFWNYQAGGLNARNQFTTSKSPLVFHQFGASAGGPIIKDKMFVFGAWESYRLTAASVVSGGVPSNWVRGEMLANWPVYQRWLDGYPLPTVDEPAGEGVAFWAGTGAEEREDDHFLIRWDYNPNETNNVNFRYTYFDPSRVIPRVHRDNSRFWIGGQKAYAGAWTSSTATLSNELRGGLNSTDFIRQDNLNGIGLMGAYLSGWSSDQSRLFGKNGDTVTVEDVIAMTKGRHSLKFGGIYQWQRGARLSDGTPRCFYNSEDAIINNVPDSCFYRFLKQPNYIHNWQVGGFIQDDFRFSSKLVINLGLRYDYYSVIRVDNDAFFNPVQTFGQAWREPGDYYQSDPMNFAPRVSFAYSLNEKTVIKSGYGMFISRFNTFSGVVDIQRDDPYTDSITLSKAETEQLGCRYDTKFVTGFEPCDSGISPKEFTEVPGFRGGGALDPFIDNPASQQWSFGIERQLTDDLAFDISYVGSHGTRLQSQYSFNQPDRVTGIRPFLDVSGFGYNSNDESSVYHSLQLEVQKRFSKGFQADFAYTWAKALAYGQGDMGCCGGDGGPQLLIHTEPGNPDSPTIWSQYNNRGWVGHQTPHRASVNWLYEVPELSTGSRALQLLARGWGIGGVFQAATGSNVPISQSANLAGARPDFVCGSFDDAILDSGLQYFDPACFASVPTLPVSGSPERPGTMGRRQLFEPGYWDLDLSLSKRFYVTERVKLQLRADLFNAFNHTSFSNIQSNQRSGTFGRLRSTRGARVTQFNLRLEW